MKKLTKLFGAALLSAALLVLAGCTPTTSTNPGNGGGSGGSGTVDTTPKAVTNLKAKAGDGKVTLTWTNPTYEKFSSIQVWYDEDSAQAQAGNLSYHKTLGTDVTSYEITYPNNSAIPLTNGTKYLFRVEAYFGFDDNNDPIVMKSAIISATPSAGPTSSVDMASRMTIGWNLGNTLDADSETGWGMPMTTKSMIDAVAAAGFKTIRIPVSWHHHVDSNYNIDSTWMARVKTIVDWAVANDMYIILNVHHDNIAISQFNSTPGFCLSNDSDIQTKSKAYLDKVWTQIATEFANYDYKLVFEVLNEPRDIGGEWKGNEWWTDNTEIMNCIKDYENTCIQAIRKVEGNKNRYLMIPGYAASGSDNSMLDIYSLPADVSGVTDKLILSTHAYSPYKFCMNSAEYPDTTFDQDDKDSLDSIFNYLKTKYVNNGIGVVMGEASASDKNNLEEREKWAAYYFQKATDAQIPVVLWDNMVLYPSADLAENHGYLNRNKLTWYYPTMIKIMMDTVGVTNYTIPAYSKPTLSTFGWNDSSTTNVLTAAGALDWGISANIIPQSVFANAKEGSILKLSFEASGASIKIIDSSWNVSFEGEIFNGSANTDSAAGDSYKVITTTANDIYYKLTASDASSWKNSNIIIAGGNGTLTGAYFQE